MAEGKKLNAEFEEVENWGNVRYVIYSNGDVELLTEYDTAYPIITAEEIRKLAEILKDNMLRNIPELRGTNALEALMNFYEDIGWDREKTLNPTKIKMNGEDWKEMFDGLVRIGQADGVGRAITAVLMINKGPSGDDNVPKGKVLWEG